MTVIINPSSSAISVIARQVAQGASGPDTDIVHAVLSQISLEDFELQDQQAWVKILNSLLDITRVRRPGIANVRVNHEANLSSDGSSTRSSLEIVSDDYPFLVDSFKMVLDTLGVTCYAIVHPVLSVKRNAEGALTAVPGPVKESVVWMEIERQSAETAENLIAAIRSTLEDVKVSVGDWQQMRERMLEVADIAALQRVDDAETAPAEVSAFLKWAAENHFTFLGYREYRLSGQGAAESLAAVPGSGLGLLRDEHHSGNARPVSSLGRTQRDRRDLMILTKTAARATVHRPTYMDYIGVLHYSADGRALGEFRFIGLFTTSAYNRRPWEIPLVRLNYDKVMQSSGLSLEGHSGKALRQILETMPREELFQATPDQLLQTSVSILSLQERFRPKLFIRKDPFGRFFSVLIYLPKDRFNTDPHRGDANARPERRSHRQDPQNRRFAARPVASADSA